MDGISMFCVSHSGKFFEYYCLKIWQSGSDVRFLPSPSPNTDRYNVLQRRLAFFFLNLVGQVLEPLYSTLAYLSLIVLDPVWIANGNFCQPCY